MSENTKIEWCDSTFNPWIGCTRVSTAATGGGGCDECYAAVSTPARAMKVIWGAHEPRHRTAPSTWKQPITWNKAHAAFFAKHGRRQRVFCASLADVFDNAVDPQWRADLFELIEDTPNLDWLLLTKRIGNVRTMLTDTLLRMRDLPTRRGQQWPWPNVWLGATIVNQEEADRDIPKLLAVPAARRFLSMEPLLGPVDLTPFLWGKHERVDSICQNCPRDADCECGYNTRAALKLPALDWVIVGGESGPGARPSQIQWFHDLRAQCLAAGVAFHMKQTGAVVLDHGMAAPGQHWPAGIERQHRPRFHEDDPGFEVHLKHRKGGDMAEWPEDLRVREFPQ